MAELDRGQHEDLGGTWSTDPFYGGRTDLLYGLVMPGKADQTSGNHYRSMINLMGAIAQRFGNVLQPYAYKDSTDTEAQFSVQAGVVECRGLSCTYAGETALGDLATGENKIWLDLSAAPTVSAGFGAAWPTIPHVKLATISMPASGHWLPQHLTPLAGSQAVMPSGAPLFALRKTLTYQDSGTIAIATVPVNALVGSARVLVTTAFDGTAPTLKIGDSGDDDRFGETTEIDLTTIGPYLIPRLYKYAAQTAVEAILTPDGSTVGEVDILLEQA